MTAQQPRVAQGIVSCYAPSLSFLNGFIQNSIGINADYFLSTSRSGGPSFPGYTAEFPSQIQAQLHRELVLGLKLVFLARIGLWISC